MSKAKKSKHSDDLPMAHEGGILETTEDESLDEEATVTGSPEEVLTGSGTLHAANHFEVHFVSEDPDSTHPTILEAWDECQVTINGVPTTLEDLKRGDKIEVFGNPVVKIVAVRK